MPGRWLRPVPEVEAAWREGRTLVRRLPVAPEVALAANLRSAFEKVADLGDAARLMAGLAGASLKAQDPMDL
jgi:hypothetical protein